MSSQFFEIVASLLYYISRSKNNHREIWQFTFYFFQKFGISARCEINLDIWLPSPAHDRHLLFPILRFVSNDSTNLYPDDGICNSNARKILLTAIRFPPNIFNPFLIADKFIVCSRDLKKELLKLVLRLSLFMVTHLLWKSYNYGDKYFNLF